MVRHDGTGKERNGRSNGTISGNATYQTWSFGPSILMRFFDTLFGSQERPDGKHSMCAKDLKGLTYRYPEHREILNVAGRYIEGQEAIVGAMKTDTKHKKTASKLGRSSGKLTLNLGRPRRSWRSREAMQRGCGPRCMTSDQGVTN